MKLMNADDVMGFQPYCPEKKQWGEYDRLSRSLGK
jgi:hypothetical protein